MEFISRFTAVILTLVLSPLLIGISICNLILQGRPIIFRQKRIGKDFKPFIIYKFRSMENKSPSLNSYQTGKNERVTRWGKFLRKTK